MAEFWAFVLQPQVLSVLALVVVFVIGLWGKRFLNHFRLVFQVWHLVDLQLPLAYELRLWVVKVTSYSLETSCRSPLRTP